MELPEAPHLELEHLMLSDVPQLDLLAPSLDLTVPHLELLNPGRIRRIH